jgi:O-antigen/teichoic acid export membrane protein
MEQGIEPAGAEPAPAAAPREPAETGERRPSFFRSGVQTYFTQIATSALGLVNVLVVARALGPAGRGDVAFLTTIGFLMKNLGSLGVDESNVNFAGRDPRLAPSLATNSVILATLLGTIAVAAVLLLVAIVPGAGGHVAASQRWLVLAAVPLLIMNLYFQYLAMAAYRFTLLNITWLFPAVLTVASNGTLALLGSLTVTRAVAAWVVGQILSTAALLWYVTRRFGGFGRPSPSLARRMLGFGVKAHAGRVMLLGNYRLDQWILGAVSSSRELGLYNVAVAWSEGLFFLPQALMQVQRPDLVRSDRREAARQAAVVTRVTLVITAVLAGVLIGLAPFLCVTIFGSAFEGSVGVLRMLAFGGFGIAALKMLGSALTAQGKPLLETASIGVAFVTIVLLDILLIPSHGGMGAAVASVIAYSAGGLAVGVIFSRALGARLGDLVPRPSDIPWLIGRLRRRAG